MPPYKCGSMTNLAPITINAQGLELSHEKFVDLCVLCGCDYTGSIKGIGPKKALALVRQVRTSFFFVRCLLWVVAVRPKRFLL